MIYPLTGYLQYFMVYPKYKRVSKETLTALCGRLSNLHHTLERGSHYNCHFCDTEMHRWVSLDETLDSLRVLSLTGAQPLWAGLACCDTHPRVWNLHPFCSHCLLKMTQGTTLYNLTRELHSKRSSLYDHTSLRTVSVLIDKVPFLVGRRS